MNINDLSKNINELSQYYIKEMGKKENIEYNIKKSKQKIEKVTKELELLDKVIILFQKTSEFARNQAKLQIENLVSKCLQYVFETNLKFEIEIETLRGKPNAEFYVISEDLDGDSPIKTKPKDSRGGGVIDVISLGLRIAFLQIHKPMIEGPIILDEPAKHVSNEYMYNVGNFLKETSDVFNRQVIMITHNEHLASLGDISYRVSLDNLTSKVSLITE